MGSFGTFDLIGPALVPPAAAWGLEPVSGIKVQERFLNAMSNNAKRRATQDPVSPVWCPRCYLRIAPYERRAMKNGKTYHEVCYSKITHAKSRTERV